MKKIASKVKDERSDCYWPELYRRFLLGDSTLTGEQGRCLYYGYTIRPEYNGYANSGFEDSVRSVLRQDKVFDGDWARVLMFTDSIMAKTPFSLRYLNYRARAARELGNKLIYDRTINQLITIGDAIKSTGDGLSIKTAMWVISVPDEYSMLARLGYSYAGKQWLVDGPCDKLALETTRGAPDAMYFNVSLLFSSMEKMF